MQHRLLERVRCGKPGTHISPEPSQFDWAFVLCHIPSIIINCYRLLPILISFNRLLSILIGLSARLSRFTVYYHINVLK